MLIISLLAGPLVIEGLKKNKSFVIKGSAKIDPTKENQLFLDNLKKAERMKLCETF